jgi:hypothetical protein
MSEISTSLILRCSDSAKIFALFIRRILLITIITLIHALHAPLLKLTYLSEINMPPGHFQWLILYA